MFRLSDPVMLVWKGCLEVVVPEIPGWYGYGRGSEWLRVQLVVASEDKRDVDDTARFYRPGP